MNEPSGKRIITGAESSRPIACQITDIDMPFLSMVAFMVKWAIAAIPALIILVFLAVIASMALVGYRGTL